MECVTLLIAQAEPCVIAGVCSAGLLTSIVPGAGIIPRLT